MTRSWHTSFVVSARLVILAAFIAMSTATSAAELAKVRVGLETKQPVLLGQKIAFHVDLLSATFFAGTPKFDLPHLSGVVLMKVDERPVVSTEQIAGDTYSVQRHQFVLFPQRPGTLTVPSLQVQFSVAAAFGKAPVEQTLTTDAFTLEVSTPPGTEGIAMLISTTELSVENQWSPRLGADNTAKLTVGDALTRQMTVRAADIPGMAFPSIPFPPQTGLGVYPKPPVVEDAMQRGEFTGQRVETVTYICEQPGTYTLPALTIPWFDVDDEQLKKVTLPAVTLEVAANPSIRADAPLLDGSQQRLPTRSPWGARVVTSIVLAAAALCWRFRRLLTARLHVWRDHRSENEAAYFARVKTACQSHDPTMTYNALLRWLDRPHNGNDAVTVEQFVHRTADDELRDQVARLEWFAFGPASIQHDAWSGLPLYTSLVRARKRAIQDNGRSSPNKHGALPPLNP